ncbi:hypothetical protein [Nocardia sp. IFM 10818]
MRRLREALEAVAVCLAAVLAGLTVMVPIDPTLDSSQASAPWVDLAVFNVPRATTAAAFVAVLAAVFAVMMSVASAWTSAMLVAVALLGNQVLWSNEIGSQSALTYVDSLWAGALMGLVGTLSWYRRTTASAFLLGALTGILVGDFTPSPTAGEEPSFLDRFLLDSPHAASVAVLAVLAGACALLYRHRPAPVRRLVDVIPLRPILAAGIVFPAILLTSEWFAQDGYDMRVLCVGVVLIVLAATAGALILPGRDGMLLLLMVAFAAAGSTPITVPRPDWAVLIFVAAIALGLLVGYRRGLPLVAAAVTAALAVGSIVTVVTGVHGTFTAVLSGTAVAFVGGYCLGAATPLFPSIPPLCIAVLFVPSAAVALWGREFERVAYSPTWYRPTEPVMAVAPGVVALVVTVGCAGGIALLYRVRPATKEAVRGRWARMHAAGERGSGAPVVRPIQPGHVSPTGF